LLHHQLDLRDGLDGCGRAALLGLEQAPRRGGTWSPLHRALEVALRFKNEATWWPWAACEPLYRLAQPWVTRYPLVKGLGNFGSIDGGAPGGPMVVEGHVSDLARAAFEDVIPRPSRDGLRHYPHDTPLAARLPFLLLNGSAPGAPGPFLLPPHNLREVAEALILLTRDVDTPVDDLLDVLLGPDFPTGGEVDAEASDLDGLYRRGRGTVRLRATVDLVEGPPAALVVTSLPYLVARTPVVRELAARVEDGEFPGVEGVRDESAPPDVPVRIVIDLAPGAADASPGTTLDRLHALTPLAATYACTLRPWRSIGHLLRDFLATRPDAIAAARDAIKLRDRFGDERRTRIARRARDLRAGASS